jgi:hypothetical protein
MSTSVLCKLEDSPLAVRPSRLHDDVLWVLNCDDNPRGQLKLLPGLAKVNDMDTCG